MKVSIVTPSYNRGYCIEKTILSVLNQTYKNVEYIVIDGCSTDDTLSILNKYASQGLLRYVSENDNGMYDAINKGFAMASGDVIAYINSDDLYFPWTVEKAVSFLSKDRHVDFVYGDTLVLDVATRNIHLNIYPLFSSVWLKSGAIIPQPTVFFRKEHFARIGNFQKDVDLIADCEYWLRGIEKGCKIKKINEFLAVEVNHQGTLREKYKEQILQEKNTLLTSYASDFTRNFILRSIILRSKYLEKEIYTLCLILKFILNIRNGMWSDFIENYHIKCNIVNYFRNKFTSSHKKIWDIDIEAFLNSLT